MFDAKRLSRPVSRRWRRDGSSRQGSGLDGLLGGAGGMLGNLQNQARENPLMSGALAGGLPASCSAPAPAATYGQRRQIWRHGGDRRACLQGLSGLAGASGGHSRASRNRAPGADSAAAERHAVHAEGERSGRSRAPARHRDDLRRQGRRLYRPGRAEAHLRPARCDRRSIPNRRPTSWTSCARRSTSTRIVQRASSPRSRRRSMRRRCSPSIPTIRPRKLTCRCSRRGSVLPDELVRRSTGPRSGAGREGRRLSRH